MHEPGPPPKHLLHLFLHIGRLLEEQLRAPLARVGVHHGQGRVLDALLRQGPLTVGELAAGLHIAQPTATVMAQRMQAAGLLERWVDADDTRRVTLTLTARGRGAAQAVRRAWQQVEEALCQSLSAADRPQLRTLLEGLRDGLGGADPRFVNVKERSDEPDEPDEPRKTGAWPARAGARRRPAMPR
jgi:MarR family transcriptional regulator, organic hydroperoxide resistance regulator